MRSRAAVLLGGLALALAAPSAGRAENPGSSLSSTRTPLTVQLSCIPGAYYCDASASGGSGSGYSFTWTNANEGDDVGGTSTADVPCYSGVKLLRVTATVTDGSGATASASAYVDCWYEYR